MSKRRHDVLNAFFLIWNFFKWFKVTLYHSLFIVKFFFAVLIKKTQDGKQGLRVDKNWRWRLGKQWQASC